MNNKFNKNIRLDYAFRFLFNFAIVDGIFVLFLVGKGLSLWQIGLLEGVFHVAGIVTEIPSGALADLVGRKKVLIGSCICSIISSIIMISTDRFWLLAIGFVFSGWTYNLVSGSEEALLYDSFLKLGMEEKYFKTNGRLGFISEVAQGIALVLGGMLAEKSYLMCYMISIGLDIINLIVCLLIIEPENYEKVKSVREHFAESYSIIKGNGRLQYVLFHYSVLFAFHTSVFLYAQDYYFMRGVSESRIGFILLGVCICTSISALISEHAAKLLKKNTTLILGIILGIGFMIMWSDSLLVSAAGFCINSMATEMLYPLQSNELNSMIPSSSRATIISVSSMCFSMVMIVVFPLVGWLTDFISFPDIILGMGIIIIIYSIVVHIKTSYCR